MNPFSKTKQFIIEITNELKKASWPTKKSLKHATCIVVITMFLLGSYISIADFVLFNGIKLISLIVK